VIVSTESGVKRIRAFFNHTDGERAELYGRRFARIAEVRADGSDILRPVPPEKIPLIESYFSQGLSAKMVSSVSTKTPVDFRFVYTNPKTGGTTIACQEMESEANYWLVWAVANYQQLPGVDFRALVAKRINGSLFDLVRSNLKHEFAKVSCLTCCGTGWDEHGKCKCVDCRGRGHTYKRNVDRIDEYNPDPNEDDPEYTYPLPSGQPNFGEELLKHAEGSELVSAVRTSLGSLPVRQRTVVFEVHANGRTQQDVASEIGKKQATVSRDLANGSRLLAELLIPPNIRWYAQRRFRTTTLPDEIRSELYKPLDWWGEARERNTAYTLYGDWLLRHGVKQGVGGANIKAPIPSSVGDRLPALPHPPCSLPCGYDAPTHGERRRWATPFPRLADTIRVPVNPIPVQLDPDGILRKPRLFDPAWDGWREEIILTAFKSAAIRRKLAELGVSVDAPKLLSTPYYRSDGKWEVVDFSRA
jgi:hypothetical protein